MSKNYRLRPYRLSAALLVAMAMPVAGSAFAQDSNTQSDEQTTTEQQAASDAAKANKDKKATDLGKVVVTGSLIPQSELETFQPITVITAEDIQTRGFSNVAEVLQHSTFATGAVQGNQTSASFTQGAETISVFGLPSGYIKYLIDGRPLVNYPALYNGSDAFNNISGIPIDLVDRIEILPGGQSSLYGSDAIAGVINIILKKNIDGGIASVRLGGYDEGGGFSQRYSIADDFDFADGRGKILIGAQYGKSEPIWGYNRELTSHYNTNAYQGADQLVGRDFLVYSPFTSYHFLDPSNCGGVAGGFGGTEQVQTRPGFGDEKYCGSVNSPGYRTLKNGKESAQVYAHATFDLNPSTQFYADLLYNRETVSYNIGSNYNFWATGSKWGYYYDPRIGTGLADAYCDGDPACPPGDLLNIQRVFVPEDMNNWSDSNDTNKSRSYAFTLGVNGTFGDSTWDYDLFASHSEYKLHELSRARLNDPINDYFQNLILGPQLGVDPYFGNYPIFEPDYTKLYQLLPPGDYYTFTGITDNASRTYDNTIRAQVTNGSLFSLPGGDAGVAVAVEAGTEGWDYAPDPLLLNGGIWGTTAVSGKGNRSRYAVTTELRLPVFDPLTISLSGRYDSYKADEKISKPTYAIGLEYRPFKSLLFRGTYGTSFKAPTLPDQFQGLSGFYSQAIDYYQCGLQGFDPSDVDNCPARYSNVQFFGQQSGNPNLEPINAKNWKLGAVWAPSAKFSLSADYFHFDISNEVSQQSVNGLLLDEYNCRNGNLDASSPTCQAAFDQITRSPTTGTIQEIFVKKVNVANRILNSATASANYLQDMGTWGGLRLAASYSRVFKHDYRQYPGDPNVDLVYDPYYSADPKWKGDASASWNLNKWTTTLYANILGVTPNYRAGITTQRYDLAGAGKLPVYTTYNLSVNYKPTEDLQLSFLVNNLTNKMPDQDNTYPGSSGAPYNSSIFSPYGRAIYLEARYNFGRDK